MRSSSKLITGAGLLLATAVATPACMFEVDDNIGIGDAVDRFCDRLVACGTLDSNGFPYTYSS